MCQARSEEDVLCPQIVLALVYESTCGRYLKASWLLYSIQSEIVTNNILIFKKVVEKNRLR
jgi:hypothetical protein